MRRFLSIILLLSTFFSLISCKEKKYEYCEFGLKLTDDYLEIDMKDTFDKAYKSDRVLIGINRLSFDACLANGLLPTHTPKKLATIYNEKIANTDEVSDVFVSGDVPFFTYKREGEGVEYLYVATFYVSQYAYFIVTFISPNTGEGELTTEFLRIANTMYFTYDT